jgi:ABC-type transport system involved in multi-copper enzyme maturation permease subunit
MIWTTWRQHRLEALAGLAVLAVTAAAILLIDANIGLQHGDMAPVQNLLLALFALPALVGMFIGAPLLSRDLEQGTHRLVWTQGTSRARWLRAKLLLVFLAVAAGATVLAALVTATVQWSSPRVDHWSWFDAQLPVFAAYVLFALALGIALGAVLRRMYPAMALTLVLYIVVRAVVEGIFRSQYQPPMRIPIDTFGTIVVPRGTDFSWFVGEHYYDAGGHELSLNQVIDLLNRQSGLGPSLAAHGLTGWAYYQPDVRFWPFQTIETAIFLVLAALLVGVACYWTTRHVT